MHHGWILAVYTVCFAIQVFIDFEAKSRLVMVGKFEKEQSKSYYKAPKSRPFQRGGSGYHHHGSGHHHHGHKGRGHGPSRGYAQGHYHHHKHHGKNGYHGVDMMDHEDSHTHRELTATSQLSFIGTF